MPPPVPPGAPASVLAGRGVALGMLPLAIEGRPSEREAHVVIGAALDAGVRVIDTADVYGMTGQLPGYAERLLQQFTQKALVATKGGLVRDPDGRRRPAGRPDHLRAACEASLRRLGVEAIDLYQLHRSDPRVPYEDSIGALVELADRGLVHTIGISNASAEQIEIALRICDGRLVSVQNRLSPQNGVPRDVLDACRRSGLALLGYGVLGGVDGARSLASRLPEVTRVAASRGVSAYQVAIAWALALDPVVMPVVGSRRPDSIRDSVAALALELSEEELAAVGMT